MTLTECQEELLGHLASMPFLDRLELVAVSGWSRGSIYEGLDRLEAEGLAASVPHATDVTPPTRRFYLTPSGLHRLAGDEGMTVDEILRLYPVSARWQRILLERLDAIAVIYRLASAIANIAHPIRFRWFRAKPMDAAIILPVNASSASSGRGSPPTGRASPSGSGGSGRMCPAPAPSSSSRPTRCG